ncbi:hypothetical protein NSU_0825 [Novosphingobium pentaromativorans US6-1]|uniref:Uncharacterized protein n=1 Tax=Novosphingobium pentaromativorans US6-1 TaxID=1088721 RepID=G6E904_9SPHN|nr:hypothetical protein NSU_0825 [Novosphingobium pentaromativorans US6-1]
MIGLGLHGLHAIRQAAGRKAIRTEDHRTQLSRATAPL